MSAGAKQRGSAFLLAFGLVAVLVAAGLSYFADSDPDGLDAMTQRGCTTVQVGGEEKLEGRCIAQHGTDHAFADGPLADYAIGGDDRWTGVAGVIGVLATAAFAGGLFRLLSRRETAGG